MNKNIKKPQAFIPSCQAGITFSLMEGEKISPAVQPLLYLRHHLLAPTDGGGALSEPRGAAPVAPPAAPGWRMVLGARHDTGCGSMDPWTSAHRKACRHHSALLFPALSCVCHHL